MSKDKAMLRRASEKMEDKINQIRVLQSQIEGLTYDQINADPQKTLVKKKLKSLIEELYG